MSPKKIVSGLATVAMLKATYDDGRDHIDMFYPFVVDAIKLIDSEDFGPLDIKVALQQFHELAVPEHSVRVLLSRACKRGHIRRDGGRYFRLPEINDTEDLTGSVREAEADNNEVADALLDYAVARNFELGGREDALEHLTAFLAENQVAAIFDEKGGQVVGPNPMGGRAEKVVAGFLREQMQTKSRVTDKLNRLLEGFVLQNTLLLSDISLAARRFKNLTVYLDTRCILGAIGLEGPVIASATREGLALLRATGARIAVFDSTLNEIQRILEMYAHRIGTKQGRDSLFQTALTRHLFTNHYSPAEVRQAQALLESNVRSLQILIQGFPKRVPDLVLDEERLSKMLMKPDDTPTEPRILHDVNCIAAMLTFRAGRRPSSLDDAVAVFCTTNGRLVNTIDSWLSEQEQTGVLPIIHQVRLTSIAWNKKPAAAPNLKIHELAALCSAALRPSRTLWSRFLGYLKRLEESGELESDEAVAIVASSLTDRYLGAYEESEDDIDSASLAEVVARVKEKYRTDSDGKVVEAEGREAAAIEGRRQVELGVAGRASAIAGVLSNMLFWGVAVLIIGSLAFTLPGLLNRLGNWGGSVGMLATGILGLFTALNLIKGWVLENFRANTRASLETAIYGWLTSGNSSEILSKEWQTEKEE